jgi:hypothetical protein
MNYKYEEVINAEEKNWTAQVKAFLDKGIQVVVFNLKPNQMNSCKALAQEHDFTSTIEDRGTLREEIIKNYPEVQPTILGFVHRDLSKRIKN